MWKLWFTQNGLNQQTNISEAENNPNSPRQIVEFSQKFYINDFGKN